MQTQHDGQADARGGEAITGQLHGRTAGTAIAIEKSTLESKRSSKLPQKRTQSVAEKKVRIRSAEFPNFAV